MSRIGKQPVTIPSGVTVNADGKNVKVKGPKGELSMTTRPEVAVDVQEKEVAVTTVVESDESSAYHGMTRALIQNMVTGVTEGYSKKLEINGVGYNAKLEGSNVVLNLGFSHPVKVPVPKGVTVEVPSPTSILISGCDKQAVGELAAVIRKKRPPEPYKGKGVKYEDEVIRRKAGKAFGSA